MGCRLHVAQTVTTAVSLKYLSYMASTKDSIALPYSLRRFSTDPVYPSKQSAISHVAFFAYLALYNAGLLNDNLLPLTSVIKPDEDGEVKVLLQDIEHRAGTAKVPIQMDPWARPRARRNGGSTK